MPFPTTFSCSTPPTHLRRGREERGLRGSGRCYPTSHIPMVPFRFLREPHIPLFPTRQVASVAIEPGLYVHITGICPLSRIQAYMYPQEHQLLQKNIGPTDRGALSTSRSPNMASSTRRCASILARRGAGRSDAHGRSTPIGRRPVRRIRAGFAPKTGTFKKRQRPTLQGRPCIGVCYRGAAGGFMLSSTRRLKLHVGTHACINTYV